MSIADVMRMRTNAAVTFAYETIGTLNRGGSVSDKYSEKEVDAQ
jgi:hypothetical protein